MTDYLFYAALLAGLVLADWPWRRRATKTFGAMVRSAMVLGAALWLANTADITSARRLALATTDRVTTLRSTEVPEYVSGVLTMSREAGEQIRGIVLPLALLVWLGLVPAGRTLVGTAKEATADDR